MISNSGHIADIVDDGPIALERIVTATPPYDLLLLDIQMTTMNGDELARRVRALPDAAQNAVPIVALTAHAFPEEHQEYLDAGMNRVLVKPYSAESLHAVFAEVIEGRYSG